MKHVALALVLLCFVSHADEQSVAGPKPNMSKKDAASQCSKEGSDLVNYRQIKTYPSAHKYLNQINDGESAWIEGYAKLSPFLSWQGCYNTSKIKAKTSIRTVSIQYQSVHRCLRACHGYAFVGLKDTSCFCIDQSQRSAIQYASVNDSFCSIPCHNNAADSCGGHFYMSVYDVLDNGGIHWAAKEPSSHLCVYVKRKQNYFDIHTTSCFSTQLIHGYICTHSAWSRLSADNCTSLTHQGTYCIIEEISTRKEAIEGCLKRKGVLADLGAESKTSALLNYNFKYWIGIHRTFGITETYRAKETVCLSATRSGGMLLLEPDDCSAQKFYLCESNSNEDSDEDIKTSLTPTSSPNRKTDNETFLTTKTPDLGSEGNNESPVTYIVPSVLIVIFIILLILFIAYRWRKKRKPQTMRPLEDNYDAINETDNMKNEYSVSSDPGLNADSKCLIVKSKPDKPERQTLKRRTAMSEYENCTLKSNTKEVKDKMKEEVNKDKDEEYDKLKYNLMPGSINYGIEENNVYNHTVGTGNDNYDTMKSVKSVHSVVRVDETYSRMNENLVLNDYCGLQGSTELLDNKEGIKNLAYNMQIERNNAVHEEEQPRRFLIIDDEEENISTKINDTQPEQLEISGHINYTDITHPREKSPENIDLVYTEIVAPWKKMKCTETDFKNENVINSDELQRDKSDENSKPLKVYSEANSKDLPNIPYSQKIDATYARVQKDFKDEEKVNNVQDHKIPLNYVKIDLPDTDD